MKEEIIAKMVIKNLSSLSKKEIKRLKKWCNKFLLDLEKDNLNEYANTYTRRLIK